MPNEYYLDQVKKCVTFIFIEKDKEQLEPVGTGFFVSIKSNDGAPVYFVTAKHFLHTASGKLYSKILLRLNTKKNTAEYLDLDLSKHVILTHSDENVWFASNMSFLMLPAQEFTKAAIFIGL